MGEGGTGRMLGRWVCMIALAMGVAVCMTSLGLREEGGKMNRRSGRWICTAAPAKEVVACMMMSLGLRTAVACMRDRFLVAWACTRIHLGLRGEGGKMSRIPGLCWVYTSLALLVVVVCMRDRTPFGEGHRMMALGERWALGHRRSLSLAAVGWPCLR